MSPGEQIEISTFFFFKKEKKNGRRVAGSDLLHCQTNSYLWPIENHLHCYAAHSRPIPAGPRFYGDGHGTVFYSFAAAAASSVSLSVCVLYVSVRLWLFQRLTLNNFFWLSLSPLLTLFIGLTSANISVGVCTLRGETGPLKKIAWILFFFSTKQIVTAGEKVSVHFWEECTKDLYLTAVLSGWLKS